jgi:hypothetical protein
MRTTQIPDSPVDLVEASLRAEIQDLLRDREYLMRELATAESLIESQNRMLVAGGLIDPELGRP